MSGCTMVPGEQLPGFLYHQVAGYSRAQPGRHHATASALRHGVPYSSFD
jgi:hypothetical protein